LNSTYAFKPLLIIRKKNYENSEIETSTKRQLSSSVAEATKVDVFERLATKNYMKMLKEKEKERKDETINFYDPEHQQPTMSKYIIFYDKLKRKKGLLSMLINNGRRIKELLMEKETTSESVNQSLYNDQHFMTCNF